LGIQVVCWDIPLWAQSQDAPLRSEDQIAVFAGVGAIKGLNIGIGYQFSKENSVHLSGGTVPFLQLTGKKATFVTLGGYHFLAAEENVTPIFSVLFSFITMSTSSGYALGNIYALSPDVGLDVTWSSGIGLNVAGGPALLIASPGATRIVLNVDIGVGFRF
jgi:hypothetical protein